MIDFILMYSFDAVKFFRASRRLVGIFQSAIWKASKKWFGLAPESPKHFLECSAINTIDRKLIFIKTLDSHDDQESEKKIVE